MSNTPTLPPLSPEEIIQASDELIKKYFNQFCADVLIVLEGGKSDYKWKLQHDTGLCSNFIFYMAYTCGFPESDLTYVAAVKIDNWMKRLFKSVSLNNNYPFDTIYSYRNDGHAFSLYKNPKRLEFIKQHAALHSSSTSN